MRRTEQHRAEIADHFHNGGKRRAVFREPFFARSRQIRLQRRRIAVLLAEKGQLQSGVGRGKPDKLFVMRAPKRSAAGEIVNALQDIRLALRVSAVEDVHPVAERYRAVREVPVIRIADLLNDHLRQLQRQMIAAVRDREIVRSLGTGGRIGRVEDEAQLAVEGGKEHAVSAVFGHQRNLLLLPFAK